MKNALIILTALISGIAHADPIIEATEGLSGTDDFIDFGANLFPEFTPITTEFAGITVSGGAYFTTGVSNNLEGGFLTQDFSNGPIETLSILFDQSITDLSFVYHQVNPNGDSVFRALLDGVVVETFANSSDQFQPNNWFGFTNIVFDELQIDIVGDFNLDSLAFNYADVPEPGTLGLLLLGGLGLLARRRRA